ncbi:MAG: hypothetical protein AAFV62_07780, partial [Pseudomonadota bacterium]
RLDFDAGQTVSLLVSPNGERFVRVNRPVGARQSDQGLPAGWVLEDLSLGSAWRADLIGEVYVLRLGDGTSYQGPIGTLPAGPERNAARSPKETQ